MWCHRSAPSLTHRSLSKRLHFDDMRIGRPLLQCVDICGVCREGKSTTISAHSGTVRSVNFSSNGRMLMSSSDDKTVKVWSLPSQRFMFTLSGHANWVRTAQFSPDCRLGVSGSDDKSMRVWDIQSKRLLRIYDEHAGVINSVAFHPDGTCVASAGTDKVIKVWDIRCALARTRKLRISAASDAALFDRGVFLLVLPCSGALPRCSFGLLQRLCATHAFLRADDAMHAADPTL